MKMELVTVTALLLIFGVLVVGLSPLVPDGSRFTYVERFFPSDRVIDIYVELAPDDLEDIFTNPLQEEYKDAVVTIDGVTVKHVGFRTKGNSSLRMVAGSDSNRYSFKIDFDQYIKGQSLAGLTKLNLNNSMSDPSYMREHLSYELLAEMGIPSPAVGYANLYINGELHGLYVTVEGIEEPFLWRTYGAPLGNLYKASEGTDLVYREDQDEQASTLKLVVGSKTTPDQKVNAMVKALATGEDLESYLNVDQLLRYFAVNTVLVNLDSYVGTFAHNYYLYEQDGVFTILPWDYNMSFAGFGGTPYLSIDTPTQGVSLESRPLLGSLLAKEEYKERYYRYLEEIISEHFTVEKMTEKINRLAVLIRPHVEADPTKFFSMEQFEASLGSGSSSAITSNRTRGAMRGGMMGMMGGSTIGLTQFVTERIQSIKAQLAGEVTQQSSAQSPFPGPMPQFPQFRGNNPMGNQAFRGQWEMPPNMAPPPGIERMPRQMPDRMRTEANVISSVYIATIGAGLALIAIACLFFLKIRNKYSI